MSLTVFTAVLFIYDCNSYMSIIIYSSCYAAHCTFQSFGKTDLDNNLAQSASNSDDEYLDTYRSEASFALR